MTSPRRAGRQEPESARDHGKAWPPLHIPGHTQADRDLVTHVHVPDPFERDTRVHENQPGPQRPEEIGVCALTALSVQSPPSAAVGTHPHHLLSSRHP